MLERADTCELPDPDAENPSCTYAGYAVAKRSHNLLSGLALAENTTSTSVSILEDRSLTKKVLPNFTIGNNRYNLVFGQYSPCEDARSSGNILKNLLYQSNGRRCNADVNMLASTAVKQTYPGLKLETDHVYEAQTLGRFFAWLAQGTTTSVGTYSLASEEWVVEVLLGIALPGQGTGNAFVMDVTTLGVSPAWSPSPVFDAMVFGFGRSDGAAGGPFTKRRGEAHLVLVQQVINSVKGVWFKGNSPDYQRGANPTADRKLLRDSLGSYQYLQWTPPGGQAQAGPLPVTEAVWNKWMRVSNWIDLICWSFDNQFANNWGTWPGAPTNNAGGNPSLRALYARYIEDELLSI